MRRYMSSERLAHGVTRQLLLRRTQNSTPLLHALRIGQSHREVAIVLIGAFSRWINHLEDEDFKQPRTRDLLKALRAPYSLSRHRLLLTARASRREPQDSD